jgi:hypothetical protein
LFPSPFKFKLFNNIIFVDMNFILM